MTEIVTVGAVALLANLLAFVLSGGPIPDWQIQRDKYNQEMKEIMRMDRRSIIEPQWQEN